MNFQGWQYIINRHNQIKERLTAINSIAHPSIDEINEQNKLIKEFNSLELRTIPEWMQQLDWSKGRQVLPSPFKEITQEEWFGLGKCGFESENASFYDGYNIPGEKEWLGGWGCHIHVYGTFALADAHLSNNGSAYQTVELGKGINVPATSVNCNKYIVRFFKIGCDHHWQLTHSEMCYREYKCTKCGMGKAEDSSG